MTVDEAFEFFADDEPLRRSLAVLREVGLGYIRLGQSATELSGGEAQRVKLATELQRSQRGETLYVLDEPTTGLHPSDVAKLMKQLDGLVEAGNTVIVVEHDMTRRGRQRLDHRHRARSGRRGRPDRGFRNAGASRELKRGAERRITLLLLFDECCTRHSAKSRISGSFRAFRGRETGSHIGVDLQHF